MYNKAQRIYEFDGFRLDVNERQLSRDGVPVALYAKAFEMLVVMVENRGRLLTKDELFSLVWSDQIVEESNLTVNMSAIRKALGERASQPRYVNTISGQGYRFVADVHELNGKSEGFWVESETISRVVIEHEESAVESGELRVESASETSNSKFEIQEQITKTKGQIPHSAFRISQFKIAVACLILVSLGIGGYFLRGAFFTKNSGTQITSIRRLTENGKVGAAALSPDGKLFAYSVSEGEAKSLWLGHTDGGEPIEIRPPANSIYLSLKFAPDGSSLYYVLSENFQRGALYRIPVFGGASEKMRDDIRWSITFAPDGNRFAFVRYDEEKNQSFLVVSDLQTASEQIIAWAITKGGFARYTPTWSPDGSTIAVAEATNDNGTNFEIFTVNVADGTTKQLTKQAWSGVRGLTWQKDGSTLIAAVHEKAFSMSQLWQIALPDGESHRLTTDLDSYDSSLSLSADDGNLLAVQIQGQSNVWIAPDNDFGAAKQITFGSFGQTNGSNGIGWMPDGKIIYTKSSDKGVTIWTMNADGSNQKQLIPNGGDSLYPAVTSEGHFVVFQSNRGGISAIWRADIDGSNLIQLTHDEIAAQPALSPDGRWVVYNSDQADSGVLRRISIDGGEPVRLGEKELNWVGISPDSKSFAAGYQENGKPKLAVAALEDGEIIKTFDVPRLANFRLGIHWTPDGNGVTYRDWANGIWKQELSGGAPARLQGLPPEKLYGYGWSLDGKQFAYVRGAEISDVVLIRNTK